MNSITLRLPTAHNWARLPEWPERSLRWMAVGAACVLLALAWAAVSGVLVFKQRDAVAAEVRQNTNLTRALEEQTVRVLATADHATVRARDAVVASGMGAVDLVRFASETGLSPGILVQLALIDAQGRFFGSNLDPDGSKTSHVDLSAREHVRVHLAAQTVQPDLRLRQPDDLFIGKPVLGKVSKRWTIQLSRRIVGANGQLLGVVVASLDPGYFEDVYRRVALGDQGGMTLVGTDFNIRARVMGGKSVGMGTSLNPNSGFGRHVQGTEGHYTSHSVVDGVSRLFAFRRVADYPLYLMVSTAEAEYLADWRATRNFMIGMTVLLSLAVALGAGLFVVNLRRLESTLAALRRSEAAANSANQAKSEFLAAVSHELRTPLTSIRGFAELMEKRLEQPKFRETAGLIRKGAEHLNELLTQILDLAKVEAGAMPLQSEAVALQPLLQGTADFFSLAATAKGLKLELELAPDLPQTLNCDGLRLKQILNNLLSNAVKFTEQGQVTIRALQRDGGVAFQVIDTGPGIPESLQGVIFEKFRQANDRVSYQHGGTGLGLALSRGLAERMKGTLSVQSAVGQGACFTLLLPTA